MRIVSHRRLVEFYSSEGHGDAQAALERWYDIAEKAEWKNLSDIKADFPTGQQISACCGRKVHNRAYFHPICGYSQ